LQYLCYKITDFPQTKNRLGQYRAGKAGRSGVITAIKHEQTAKKFALTIWTRLRGGEKEEETDLKQVWAMATAISSIRVIIIIIGWRS